jgi:hypothetical protein
LIWRNRKKISQIINDYFYLPFFLLIIFLTRLIIMDKMCMALILVFYLRCKSAFQLLSVSRRPNWLRPSPRPQESVAPLWFLGGDTLACREREWADPIRTRGQTLWYCRYSVIPLLRYCIVPKNKLWFFSIGATSEPEFLNF